MSNTLSDKTNKSIADIANKIMQEQPTKMRDFSDTKPIQSDMVQRVMNLKVPNHFVKEEVEQVDENLGKHLLHAVKHLATAEIGDVSNPSRNNKKYRAAVDQVRASHGDKAAAAFHAHASQDAQHLIGSSSAAEKRGHEFFSHMNEPEKSAYHKGYSKLLGESEQIDEALDHEVNNYAKHMLNAHSAEDLHVGNDHRQEAHTTLKHIEKNYGPVGVRWAEARAGEHIENHNKAQREAEKASTMKYYKPTPPGAKVYQYPKSEVKENSEQINEARFGKAIDRSKLSAAARARLEARDKKAGKEVPKAEPAPTSAAVGKRAGRAAPKAKESPMAALAQSFGAKKKAAAMAEPAKDETPAQKARRISQERQNDYYEKGGNHSGVNVGSGGRSSVTGHNTSTAGGAVAAVKSQGRIKTGGLHSVAVDEELKGNQTALDVAKPYGKLTAQDFKALRAKHKKGN